MYLTPGQTISQPSPENYKKGKEQEKWKDYKTERNEAWVATREAPVEENDM